MEKIRRRCVPVSDRRFCYCPRFGVIGRTKHARRRPTGNEGYLRTSKHEASSARRERALIGQRRRHTVARHFVPVLAVRGRKKQKFPVHGIAQCHTLRRGTVASQSIQKNFFALSRVFQFPIRSTIRRFVYPRFVAFAAGHHIRPLRVKRPNAAKIQLLAAGYVQLLPCFALVLRLQNYAVRPGSPNNGYVGVLRHRILADRDRAQIRIQATGLHHPPRPLGSGCAHEDRCSQNK